MDKDYADKMLSSLEEIEIELLRAKNKFPNNFNTKHEGYAVLLEEVEELKDEIFWGDKKWAKSLGNNPELAKSGHIIAVRDEAKQVAAMALRIMIELT